MVKLIFLLVLLILQIRGYSGRHLSESFGTSNDFTSLLSGTAKSGDADFNQYHPLNFDKPESEDWKDKGSESMSEEGDEEQQADDDGLPPSDNLPTDSQQEEASLSEEKKKKESLNEKGGTAPSADLLSGYKGRGNPFDEVIPPDQGPEVFPPPSAPVMPPPPLGNSGSSSSSSSSQEADNPGPPPPAPCDNCGPPAPPPGCDDCMPPPPYFGGFPPAPQVLIINGAPPNLLDSFGPGGGPCFHGPHGGPFGGCGCKKNGHGRPRGPDRRPPHHKHHRGPPAPPPPPPPGDASAFALPPPPPPPPKSSDSSGSAEFGGIFSNPSFRNLRQLGSGGDIAAGAEAAGEESGVAKFDGFKSQSSAGAEGSDDFGGGMADSGKGYWKAWSKSTKIGEDGKMITTESSENSDNYGKDAKAMLVNLWKKMASKAGKGNSDKRRK